MLDGIGALPGIRLDLATYLDDSEGRLLGLRDSTVWKFERRQRFRQPESDSWTAFSQGRWTEALRLLEDNRPSLQRELGSLAESGTVVTRVRVVEQPLDPYLQWELHSLFLRTQYGERIRVIAPPQIPHSEGSEPLPEVLTLGEGVTYRILYDDAGVLSGAVRHTDPDVTLGCRDDIAKLYDAGEDLAAFFHRDVAPLDPPAGQ
ncbi:DUF6879 family protein [Nocardiopsis aegyptia]|uniref:DUF6879 family protein n=1 Tax=Nocardiopsis aegyptia TaxID=220378 RepID=UPI00366F9285